MPLTRHVRDFQKVGGDLMLMGLNNSHSGNMSLRQEGTILITRTGSQLGHLEWDDIVETSLHVVDAAAARASRELPAHRAIYQGTKHRAVVHCHAPYTTALSWVTDAIVPEDAEGRYYLPEVPVVTVANPIGTEELAAALQDVLRVRSACVVRTHGCFVAANDLEKCLQLTTCLESVCRLLFLRRCMDPEPLRK